MRAFTVAWRAIRSWLNELGFLAGISLLWFITGGIMVVAAALLGWPMAMVGGPWWLAPLLAIQIGPAMVARWPSWHGAAPASTAWIVLFTSTACAPIGARRWG